MVSNVKVIYLSESAVRSMKIGPEGWASSSLVSEVRMMTGGAVVQMWSLKTLRVITTPQWHIVKSFLKSVSERPEESSLRRRISAYWHLLTSCSYAGTDALNADINISCCIMQYKVTANHWTVWWPTSPLYSAHFPALHSGLVHTNIYTHRPTSYSGRGS